MTAQGPSAEKRTSWCISLCQPRVLRTGGATQRGQLASATALRGSHVQRDGHTRAGESIAWRSESSVRRGPHQIKGPVNSTSAPKGEGRLEAGQSRGGRQQVRLRQAGLVGSGQDWPGHACPWKPSTPFSGGSAARTCTDTLGTCPMLGPVLPPACFWEGKAGWPGCL